MASSLDPVVHRTGSEFWRQCLHARLEHLAAAMDKHDRTSRCIFEHSTHFCKIAPFCLAHDKFCIVIQTSLAGLFAAFSHLNDGDTAFDLDGSISPR
mmetsp:Transcript_77323/g.122089  ORF Transcript_77323/g.122089 Transcript_77323/m.122089 type:complete len:97 (+) Transcript_77323:1941-2231(+)